MLVEGTTVSNSVKGRWELKVDKNVQEQMNKVDKIMGEYCDLSSAIRGIVPSINACSDDITATYDKVVAAIKISDERFNENMSNISAYSNNLKSASSSLNEALGAIATRIEELAQEKIDLSHKLYKKVWVTYK